MKMAKLWDKNDHQNHPIFDPSLVRTDPPDQLRLESGKTTTTPINMQITSLNEEGQVLSFARPTWVKVAISEARIQLM